MAAPISTGNDIITLTDVNMSGNTAAANGGAILTGVDAIVTINNSTISNNFAAGGIGGGLAMNTRNFLTISNSTVANNNTSSRGGGIAMNNGGNLTVQSCTISGNTSNFGVTADTSTSGGGGIYMYGAVFNNPALVENSTIANNVALFSSGGGIRARTLSGTFAVRQQHNYRQHCGFQPQSIGTFSTVNYGGGGFARTASSGNGSSIQLLSDIVSGNVSGVSATQADIASTGANVVTATFTAIGVAPASTVLNSNVTGNLPVASSSLAALGILTNANGVILAANGATSPAPLTAAISSTSTASTLAPTRTT